MPIQLRDDGDPLAPHSVSPRELQTLLAAERAGQAFLAFRDQLGLLSLFPLNPTGDGTTTIGRRAEMDVAITWDGEVSGLHAELQMIGGELAIDDDGLSTNGTYVNGERISGRQRLRDADRIRVGRTVLVYRTPEIAPALATISAIDSPELLQLSDTQRRVLVALCRPYRDGIAFATPASNQDIADEVYLGIDAVKTNLRALFTKFELGRPTAEPETG
jgi:hypothetical protein